MGSLQLISIRQIFWGKFRSDRETETDLDSEMETETDKQKQKHRDTETQRHRDPILVTNKHTF